MLPKPADRQVADGDAGDRHAGLAQDQGVDHDDIGHGQEGRQSGKHFGANRGAVASEVEQALQHGCRTLFLKLWGLGQEGFQGLSGAGGSRDEVGQPIAARSGRFASTRCVARIQGCCSGDFPQKRELRWDRDRGRRE